jgi:hypothetical protein
MAAHESEQFGDIRLIDLLAVYPDAFRIRMKVGGCKQPHLQTRLLENGSKHGCGRSLAVCASHMDKLHLSFRMT